MAAVGSMSAQKANVDQAEKLAGKADKLSEARSLIKQAMENPETKNEAKTYYVAGKIEFEAYDNATKAGMINPDDPSAKPDVMAEELMSGYDYFLKALPLDSVPDAKGKVKPKYSKDILNKIAGHANDFFTVGANCFNDKKFYPEAYNAFMVYGDLPGSGMMGNAAALIPEDQIATAYFNAGLSAYQGDQMEKSAEAFRKARLAGYAQPEAYIYEIACWQTVAQRDEARTAEAQKRIMEIASAGHEKYGLEQPIFINNMINSLVVDNKIDEALAKLNEVIAANPDNAGLLGLRGYVYDRAENDDASEADYRKAVSLPNVDSETVKNAAKKVFRIGTKKWDAVEVGTPETAAKRQEIKTNYFDVAKQYADKVKELNPNDTDIDTLLDSINYVLETYFN